MDVPIKAQTVFAYSDLTLTREGYEQLEKNIAEGSVILPQGSSLPELQVEEHRKGGIASLMVLSGSDLGFTMPTARSVIYSLVLERYGLALLRPEEVWGFVGVRIQRRLSGITMWASGPFPHCGESKLFGLSYSKGENHRLSQATIMFQPGDDDFLWEPDIQWIFRIA